MEHAKRIQILLRIVAILLLVLTACLIGLDSQSKLMFDILNKKATFKDLDALFVLVHVVSVGAGYQVIQLCQEFLTASRCCNETPKKTSLYMYLNWVCLIFDQAVAYLVFAASAAALQASVLAVTGEESFQWMKLCDTFTRFCYQIGGGLICCFIACFVLAAISCISAFGLFRHYSAQDFIMAS